MSGKGFGVIGFCLGAVVGSGLTYILLKKKFEQQAQTEIDNIRTMYKNELKKAKGEEVAENNEKIDTPQPIVNPDNTVSKRPYMDKPSPVDYAAMNGIAIDQGYVQAEQQRPMSNVPYVIPPDEVGEMDGYRSSDLIYFADGVLTDDQEEPIDDPMGLVGPIALNSFGEYEDDSVCVRNDARKCDYVILRSEKEYYDTHE